MFIKIEPTKIDDCLGFLNVFFEIGELHRINVSWNFNKPNLIFLCYY